MLEAKKEKKQNFKLNAVFNAIYQVLILIVPLITTPYISTVFNSNTIGSYSFGYSTTQYFVLAADFGFTLYGTTVIAKSRKNKLSETKNFWSIIYSKFILDAFILVLYFALTFSGALYNNDFPLNNTSIFLIFSMNIFASLFDVTFLFQGKEKFFNLCIRNLLVKALSTTLIFLLVKEADDYMIYVIIMCFSYLFSGLITFLSVPFMVGKPVKVPFSEIRGHYKNSLVYFIPSVATTIYTVASKSVLGWIQGDSSQNGFYEQANKIVDIILTIVNSVNTIMMARMAYLYANKMEDEINRKITKMFQVYCVLSFPATLGLIAVNDFLTLGFLGGNFEGSIPIIYILSLKLIIVPISGILGSIYYIPNNELKKRTIFLVSGAVFNLCVNSLLVYFLSAMGAAIATVLTETLVTVLYVLGCYKHIKFNALFKDLIRCLPCALTMFTAIFFLKGVILQGITNLLYAMNIFQERIAYFVSAVCLAAIGALCYGVMLLIVREPFVTSLLIEIKNKIFKKKNEVENV